MTDAPRAKPGRENPGSQSALRKLNEQRILDTLTSHGTLTQAGLARVTGLSTATVSNIVKTLAAQNRVETATVTSSGRRALGVSLLDVADVAAGIDFGRSHVRVV